MLTTPETIHHFCLFFQDEKVRKQRGLQTYPQWCQAVKDHNYPYELVYDQMVDWINYYNALHMNRVWHKDTNVMVMNILTSLKIDRGRW